MLLSYCKLHIFDLMMCSCRNLEKAESTVGKHFRSQQKNQVKKSKFLNRPNIKQNQGEMFSYVVFLLYITYGVFYRNSLI